MIYTIGDLHLSFSVDKPMDIFGNNWENHTEKIKNNWIQKVRQEDTVVLPGDFSWAMNLEETYKDFKYLNNLPGKKILLKGNHDYWWTTVTSMNKYLKENNCVENKILVGTRGWITSRTNENYRLQRREVERLIISINDGISKFGKEKEIIVFMHYPPFYKEEVSEEIDFINVMKKYNVKKCFYGHLHSESHKEAIEGLIHNIEFKLISSDYLEFNLTEI